MVLSNKKLKQRLRAVAAREQGTVPPTADKPNPTNKREKQRQRRQQLETSSAQPRQSPDTPAIAQAELDIYQRCVETLLHERDSGPSSRQGENQEEVLVPRHLPKEQGKDAEVLNIDQNVSNANDSSSRLPRSNLRKRKNTLEPNPRTEKQEEKAQEQGQGQPSLVNSDKNTLNGDSSRLPMPIAKSKKHKTDVKINARMEQQIKEAADHSAEDQDSSESRTIYVGGIPYYSSEDDIKAFFSDCGTISEANLKTFSDSGKFRGIALLTFKTAGGAQRALALDGASMGDRFLKIQPSAAKPKEPVKKEAFVTPPMKTEGYLRAYIGNLSWSVTEEDIRDFFKGCKIDKVNFSEDKVTGEFRGFGHVDFADDESLERALQLDQEILLERPIKVAYAVPNRTEKRVGTPARLRKDVACYACGEKGHVSSRCPYMGRGQ